MVTLTKEAIEAQLATIAVLDKIKLIEKAGVISVSHIDDESRKTLNHALDLRLAEMSGIDTSGLVVKSEILPGEVE